MLEWPKITPGGLGKFTKKVKLYDVKALIFSFCNFHVSKQVWSAFITKNMLISHLLHNIGQ